MAELQQTEGRAKFGSHETWYRITGDLDSSRPPIFILHGGPGAAHNYVDSYKLLSRGGRAVIHYDQLGCGKSTHLPDKPKDFWTPQLFVDGRKVCNEDTDLGLEYTLTRMLAAPAAAQGGAQ